MSKDLKQALSYFHDKIFDCIKSNKSIFVLTHIDCDGISSGSIIAKALIRAGANCTVRATKELNKYVISYLKKNSRDLHIITDLGGGFAKDLDDFLAENWLVLDHHEISEDEHENERVINAWKYGIDGGVEICAGGMAYLAANSLDDENTDLSPIAIVSALGDRQDQGEKKSFTGKNFEIVKTAKDKGLLEIDLDLLLVGRETRPLIDALAFTSRPFIEGLTWNRDACFSLINSVGIKIKDGQRWRVPAELAEDEKRVLIEGITQVTAGKDATSIMEELVGYTYSFPREDKSFLRDGRDFATLLNSCGRIGKAGVGIAICMGDRNKMLQEGENILSEYRKMIRNCMNVLANERWRISDNKNCVMVNGEGIIPETMSGTISSLIAGSPKNSGKIVILRTNGDDEGTIKFSSRKSSSFKSDLNLSKLMRQGAEKFDGVGGGHDAAAGARITKDKLDGFLDYLEANVINVQSSSNS